MRNCTNCTFKSDYGDCFMRFERGRLPIMGCNEHIPKEWDKSWRCEFCVYWQETHDLQSVGVGRLGLCRKKAALIHIADANTVSTHSCSEFRGVR